MVSARGALLALILALLPSCASPSEDETAASGPAMLTLSAEACGSPDIATTARVEHGEPIAGTAHTQLRGCFVGADGETGVDLIANVSTLFADVERFGALETEDGTRIFSKFDAGPARGTLDGGIVQEVDVAFDMDYSPATRLRVTRKLRRDGTYELQISNVTAMRASFGLLPVTVVKPGNLALRMEARPEANGLTITGSGDVALEVSKGQASATSELVSDLFAWLRAELAR